MCVQNLNFLALPVPEIIGGIQKIGLVPVYAHAPLSPIFYGLLLGLSLRMFRTNSKFIALSVLEIIRGSA